ncbi:hypothetical protein HGM15179_007001 [Zosterops borbonicus]|uniref:Uncharacterized protein n=1 Tax=Zosterops borbonicus TaxID=364589 RepID=A0A8K1GM72_9PASS|nr:hypothetical protein HGM15179_007001 [Zosterops borbonicus]
MRQPGGADRSLPLLLPLLLLLRAGGRAEPGDATQALSIICSRHIQEGAGVVELGARAQQQAMGNGEIRDKRGKNA